MDAKKKILIIEDEKTLIAALKKKLLNAGFDVITSENGLDGVTMALSEKPDLILLDMILPQLDGLSVLDQLKTTEWGQSVPVIVLTNLAQIEAKEESMKRGVQEYLIKTDWKLVDVLQKINTVLGTHQ